MTNITVLGYANDRLIIEGDINTGLYVGETSEVDPIFLAVEDGTILQAFYDKDGIWRISCYKGGLSKYRHQEVINHSETVKLSGDFRWCVLTREIVEIK